MKPSHLRRFHTQGWMAMQDGVHLGSNFLREAAMNVAPGTRNGPVGELLVVVQAVAGSSPVAHPSGSPGKPGVFCCARPNRRGARGTNEVPILPANAASEGFLRAVRSQFPATRRPVEWLPLPHSRERVAQRVPARSTPNEAQIATGATGQAACRTSAWWTRPTLPGLLTRAEIDSYWPDFGLCDSLTRKGERRFSGDRAARLGLGRSAELGRFESVPGPRVLAGGQLGTDRPYSTEKDQG